MKLTTKNNQNAVYCSRYLQGEESETVEHKLRILKQEIKYIIEKLTDLKDFVFADPHKKEAYAHCTHLQIALADPQTKICKRVQSFHPTSSKLIMQKILL